MDLYVRETVSQANWKLTTILRSMKSRSWFKCTKSKILSFVEYRIPAVYHAARTILAGIDAIQKRFLRECGLTEEDALVFFNLAPLETRRDIAMLGLIQRTVLGSETRLAPPVTPWFPKSSETGPFHTGSHRCLQHASSKGG